MSGQPMTWVMTEPMEDGGYALAVHYTDDVSMSLGQDEVAAYCAIFTEAIERARYDAAVLAQCEAIDALGPARASAAFGSAALLSMLRERRSARLTFRDVDLVPIVTSTGKRGKVNVFVGGRAITQWGPLEMHGHVRHVMEGAAVARLDTGYRALIGSIAGDMVAMAMVGDLNSYRDDAFGEQRK